MADLFYDSDSDEDRVSRSGLSHILDVDAGVIQQALKRFQAVNANEPLLNAIMEGNVDLVESLIQQGLDVNPKEGISPLSCAIRSSNPKMVSTLIANKADVRNDFELLSLAVVESSTEVIEILLRNGAGPNKKWKKCAPVLHPFRVKTRYDVQEGPTVYAVQKKGRTALHLAVDIGRVDAVNLLLEYGADIDSRTNKRLTPLMIAAYKGNLNVVQILLDLNAEYALTDSNGRTALHAAAENGYFDILKSLLHYCFSDVRFVTSADFLRIFSLQQLYKNRDQPQRWHTLITIIVGNFREMVVVRRHTNPAGPTMLSHKPILSLIIEKSSPYSVECKKEVAKLNGEMVGTGVSFFDFLNKKEDQLVNLVNHEEVVETFKSNDIEAKFKIYGGILRSQFRKGETRKKLLQQGTEVIGRFQFDLPELAMENILKFMNNRTIKVFITACTLYSNE